MLKVMISSESCKSPKGSYPLETLVGAGSFLQLQTAHFDYIAYPFVGASTV